MNFQLSYHSFLQGILYVLLISQLWTNAISHCYWLVGADSDLIEYYSSEDSESEKEEEKKEKEEEEKKDRFQSDLFAPILGHKVLNARFLYSIALLSIHHPEIATPPPKGTAYPIHFVI